jgi:cyclophilin family peptidyl-prolyl cis-trans isomerase
MSRFRFHTAFLIVLLLAASGLAACGGDGDSTSTGDTTAEETATQSTEESTDAGTEETTEPTAAPTAGAADCGEADPKSMSWSEPEQVLKDGTKYTATMKTKFGDIVIDLLPEDAPGAVNSFVFLAQNCFYHQTPVHRIVPGFVIQGGDPTGTGTGGPGYTIEDEPSTRPYSPGTLAMARTPEPNSTGSQWFITLEDLTTTFPNKEYIIFGTVTKGMEAVKKIAAVEVEDVGTGEVSSPVEPVVIDDIVITETPA